MLRMNPIASGKRAEHYYAVTDGGYYQDGTGLQSRWGGIGADLLGLTGLTPEQDQFSNLVQGLDPRTGEQLTARLRDDRIPGWDVTGSVPKRVTEALECGDERIQPAIWRALERTMKKARGIRHDTGARRWQAGGPPHRQSRLVRGRACRNPSGRG